MTTQKYNQEQVNNTIWQACDTFRGKIDSSIYKDYVLVMLFIKYVSDIYKEDKEKLMKEYENDVEMVERQMRYERFASDAGKKGGEFFTPSEVSELLSRLVKPQENDRIYDPTCGSGSLLLKAYNKVSGGKAQFYGQQIH
jgi:type I restriction-modification system DNA methylase subunit